MSIRLKHLQKQKSQQVCIFMVIYSYIGTIKIHTLAHATACALGKKIQNYTNKALAKEAGFSSTQRFANAFFARVGMPTSYFIEELQKKNHKL